MAGDEGFEPPNTRTRTWRLTAWPIPTTDLHYILLSLHILVFWSLDQNLYRKYLSGDKFRGLASAPSRFRPCRLQTCNLHLTAWPIHRKISLKFSSDPSQLGDVHHPRLRPCKLPRAVFTHYKCLL